MNRIALLLLCSLCLIASSGQMVLATTYYDPPESEPAPYAWCSYLGGWMPSRTRYVESRTDTLDQEVQGDSLTITDDRCESSAETPIVNVTLGSGTGYTYSKAHSWSVGGHIEFIKDVLGISACGGENTTEEWTCTEFTSTQVPVTCQGTAAYRMKHYAKWSVDTYDYTYDVKKVCIYYEGGWHYHNLPAESATIKDRTLESQSKTQELSHTCRWGIECGCDPCGTWNPPSGPCTGSDCPNSWCSHYGGS